MKFLSSTLTVLAIILAAALLFISFFTSNQHHELFYQLEDYYFLFCGSALLLTGLLKKILSGGNSRIGITRMDLWFCLFAFYILLRLIPSVHVSGQSLGQSFDQTFVQPFVQPFTGKLLLGLSLFFMLKCLIREFGNLAPLFLQIIVLVAMIQASMGILQYAGIIQNQDHSFKIGGTFGNPGIYASFLAVVFPIVFNQVLSDFKQNSFPRENYVYYAALMFISVILPFTNARIAWVAVLFAIVYLSERHFQVVGKFIRNNRFSRLTRIVVCTAFIILSLAMVAVLFKFKEPSAKGRLFIWTIGSTMIGDHFLWGAGPNTFEEQYNIRQAKYFENQKNIDYRSLTAGDTNVAYNEYLQIFIEYGLAGLLLLLMSIAWYVQTIRKTPTSLSGNGKQAGVETSVFVLLILALTAYPFHLIFVMVNILFLLAILDYQNVPILRIRIPTACRRIVALVPFLLMAMIMVLTGSRYLQEKEWKKADLLFSDKRYDSSFSIYHNLYARLSAYPVFTFDYATKYYLHGDYAPAITLFELSATHLSTSYLYTYMGICYYKLGKYALAETNLKMASMIAPRQFLPKYYLYKMYKDMGNTGAASRIRSEVNQMTVPGNSEGVRVLIEEINQ